MCTSITSEVFVAVVCCLAAVTCGGREKRDDGKKIVVTTIEDPPFVIVRAGSSVSSSNKFDGFMPELMKKISDKANINYEIRLVADSKYGSQDDKGTWNGMIGEVIDKRADLAAAPITISEKRREAVDFSVPFMKFGLVVLMKKGTDHSIKSLQGLADQTKIKYGAVRHGVTQNFFKNSIDPAFLKIHTEMTSQPNNMMRTIKEGVDKVRSSDGKYAFIMESSYAEYWVNQEPCDDLEIVGKTSDSGHMNEYALITRQRDGLRERVSQAIKSLEEDGEIAKLKKKWWLDESACGASAGGAIVGTVPLAVSLSIGVLVYQIGRFY